MKEKYNRIFHLPWSSGTNDDKIAKSVDSLLNVPIVIQCKFDGSNVCMMREACFSRSHSGPPTHPSFNQFKILHATIKWSIPEDIQIFGEWLFAQHSIYYDKLPSFFLGFGIRNINTKIWYSTDDTLAMFESLNLKSAPIDFKGIVKAEQDLKDLAQGIMESAGVYGPEREGLVIRLASAFDNKDFSISVMKQVRPNHVKTDAHWAHQAVRPNKLAKL